MNRSLQAELLHKISLLLDKPMSQKSTKQIISNIQNEMADKQKIFALILSKFRSDLILFMLKSYQFSKQFLSQAIKNLIKNVSQYEIQPLKQIWKMLIIHFSQLKQNSLYKYSYQDLLKEALKVTNLQKKNMIFEILNNNIKILHSLGEKGLIITIQSTYIQIFKKFQINVPFYISILSTLCKINAEKQLKAVEKQEIQLQILPQITIQDRINLINQIKLCLIATKLKPMHQLHKQCLIALTELYNYKNNEYKDLNILYEIKQLVEKQYLYRKSTRDEARSLINCLQFIQSNIKKQNKGKTVKQYDYHKSQKLQLLNSNNVLIENVINRTNQYLSKYKVKNIQKNNDLDIKEMMGKSTNIFLKKGQGVGGGKTYLEDSPIKKTNNARKSSLLKDKNKYDILLQECLNKVTISQNKKKQNQQLNFNQKKTKKGIKNLQYEVDDVRESKSIFVQNQYKNLIANNQFGNLSNSNTTVDLQNRQDDEINQVNELIDLAYSYKFSL